ncbi:MAG TPA: Spy/CpxP family protein refolding chaperone [Myxococcota bacterium]
MHPGFIHWWKEAQRQHHEHHGHHAHGGPGFGGEGCGPRRHHHHGPGDHPGMAFHFGPGGGDDGGGFGVRRPLRFMAWKLELDEAQIEQLATILDALKTERAQAAVDLRRSVAGFADALGGEAFDVDGATAAAQLRVTSAERLKQAVLDALKKTHAMLNADQRKQLVYLLRSGQLTI